MQRDFNQPCHCPPQELCPQTISEWHTHPRMPANQATICCDVPNYCTATFNRFETDCPRPDNEFETETFVQHCEEFEPIILQVPPCVPQPDKVEVIQVPDGKEGVRLVTVSTPQPDDCTARDNTIAENQRRVAANAAAEQCVDNCIASTDFTVSLNESQWNSFDSCLSGCPPSTSKCVGEIEFRVCTNTVGLGNCGGGEGPGDGGGGEGDCLAPDSLVLMEDGSQKHMDEIKPGDTVKGQLIINNVKRVVVTEWDEIIMYSINNGKLVVTEDHPLMTKAGWRAISNVNKNNSQTHLYGLKNVGQLVVGDTIIASQGNGITVETIEALEKMKNYKTYNLVLDGSKAFYANGVLVRAQQGN
jgi:hypothetical protein